MTSRHLLAPARLAGSKLLGTQRDERLVDLMRAGSEPAFEAIVSRYRGPLIRYCSALLGRERAEDAVQQTFVNAYEAMRGDDRPLRLKPWLYRIAHNVAHNALRSGALRDRPLELPAEAERPELVLERRDRLRAVLASVQALPERQRDAILLRELEGRSYEEIEAALGAGGGAVRQLLNRARTTLRTAATAVTPVGLLLRLPGSGAAGESVTARVAELTGAAGAGTIAAKVAATALVTGAVAGGAAVAPLGDSDGKPPRERPAAVAPAERGTVPSPIAPAAVAPASQGLAGDGSGDEVAGSGRDGRQGDSSGPGSGDEDRGDGDSGDNSGPGSDSSGPGSGSSGPGSSGSGSDSSGSGSGSSGSGSDSSGSGSSGSDSGSTGTGSGSTGTGSGSSGSDSSGSAPSGAVSSGSGSGDPGSDSSGD